MLIKLLKGWFMKTFADVDGEYMIRSNKILSHGDWEEPATRALLCAIDAEYGAELAERCAANLQRQVRGAAQRRWRRDAA